MNFTPSRDSSFRGDKRFFQVFEALNIPQQRILWPNNPQKRSSAKRNPWKKLLSEKGEMVVLLLEGEPSLFLFCTAKAC